MFKTLKETFQSIYATIACFLNKDIQVDNEQLAKIFGHSSEAEFDSPKEIKKIKEALERINKHFKIGRIYEYKLEESEYIEANYKITRFREDFYMIPAGRKKIKDGNKFLILYPAKKMIKRDMFGAYYCTFIIEVFCFDMKKTCFLIVNEFAAFIPL